MRRFDRRAPVLAAMAVVAVLVAACGDEAPAPTLSAPVSAVRAAGAAMLQAPSFIFSGSVVSAGKTFSLAGAFAAPDGLREVVSADGVTVEVILVHGVAYRQNGSGAPWQRVATGSAAATDPRAPFGVLSSVGDAGGGATTEYVFTLHGADAAQLITGSSAIAGTVKIVGGKITALGYSSKSPAVTVSLTYAGVGATAVITAPPTAESPGPTPSK